MAITCVETGREGIKKTFKLDTKNTSYIFSVVDNDGFLIHLYYGDKINSADIAHVTRMYEYPFYPGKSERERCSYMDFQKFEYPGHNVGDYREDCISVRDKNGNFAVNLKYVDYKIESGKPALKGLPATFASGNATVDTLTVILKDEVLGLSAKLLYSVFEEYDVITRSVEIINDASEPIYLTKVMSACLDMENDDYEAITLHGSWARERHIETTKINHTKLTVESVRGETSHQDQPFVAIKAPNTTNNAGNVYGMNLIYSGNFKLTCKLDQFDQIRATIGINPESFCYKLEAGDSFVSPEAVMTFSNKGLNKMSQSFHDLYRNNLIRSKYKDMKRPILINNWEATYFNFDTEKLLDIARDASKLGIEMLVMDDGWFGNRSSDDMALGDWIVNEEKIKGGLKYLVDEVNKLGMKFGIWFEPEMISPDSDLYRAHPDWAIACEGRVGTQSRHQFVLDITRKEVRDYAYESVAKILRSANIEYVKWDMNRQLTDIGSVELPADKMGEFYHRYVLAVYEMQERLITEFPDLLLENCSGGGARFDAGMLYYSPQIWCSDDTDAIERLAIQEGTAIVYPLSAMGAHVSDCPNHTVGRTTPFETRGFVALSGTFGYELDVTRIPEEDRNMIPDQVKLYHRFNDLVRNGDYVRIASYRENGIYDLYGSVAKDKSEALFTYIQVRSRANYHSKILKLDGLDINKTYTVERIGSKATEDIETYSGDVLMKVGILMKEFQGDNIGELLYVKEVK